MADNAEELKEKLAQISKRSTSKRLSVALDFLSHEEVENVKNLIHKMVIDHLDPGKLFSRQDSCAIPKLSKALKTAYPEIFDGNTEISQIRLNCAYVYIKNNRFPSLRWYGRANSTANKENKPLTGRLGSTYLSSTVSKNNANSYTSVAKIPELFQARSVVALSSANETEKRKANVNLWRHASSGHSQNIENSSEYFASASFKASSTHKPNRVDIDSIIADADRSAITNSSFNVKRPRPFPLELSPHDDMLNSTTSPGPTSVPSNYFIGSTLTTDESRSRTTCSSQVKEPTITHSFANTRVVGTDLLNLSNPQSARNPQECLADDFVEQFLDSCPVRSMVGLRDAFLHYDLTKNHLRIMGRTWTVSQIESLLRRVFASSCETDGFVVPDVDVIFLAHHIVNYFGSDRK